MATARTWNGGVADFLDPNAWTPFGVPSPHDALTIHTGISVAQHLTIDQSIFFRHSQFSPDPVPELAISDVKISADSKIYTDNILVALPVLEFLPGGHGRIEASGHNINYGTIGAYSRDVVSIGSTLDIDLKAGLFVNEGTLHTDFISSLNVTATEDAVLKNNGTIDATEGRMVIDARIIGDGLIQMGNAGGHLQFLHGSPVIAHVELGGSVGKNQTVDIFQGRLTIDDVSSFHADIKDFSHLDFAGFPLEAIILKGVDVTSFSYRNSNGSGVLTLKSGDDVVGKLSFLGDYSEASFHTSYANGTTTLTV